MLKKLFGFLLLLSCLQAQDLKIATYNIFFLDDKISPARTAHLQSVIHNLNADVIAFEEIENIAALVNILPSNYHIAMLDDPEAIQETALAVREPLRIINKKYVFPGDSFDYAFPRVRDLLQVKVLWKTDTLYFMVHHAKSRRGGRMKTDTTRVAAARLITEYVKKKLKNKQVVLIGDFNDNPDDRSLNVLESGNPDAVGGIDHYQNELLVNVTEKLLESDICSYGFHKNPPQIKENRIIPIIPGSRKENNRWRNKKFNYYKDVKIKAILLDQILLSPQLASRVTQVDVYRGTDAITGKLSKIKFVKGHLVYTFRGDMASDHVPVFIVLKDFAK